MSCNLPDIPEYLHWNNRQIYTHQDFLPNHKIYRLTSDGNPIEFPQGTITALSCKWSFLIEEEHILKVDVPPVGNGFKYALGQAINDYFLKRERNDGNTGWHKLTCMFNHDPKVCDYSHIEVNIVHEIFEDEAEQTLIHKFVYTYQIWQNNNNLLQGKAQFFKNLKKDYRADLIRVFCNPI